MRAPYRFGITIVLSIYAAFANYAHADALSVVNKLRTNDCAGHTATQFTNSNKLASAAKLLNKGVAIRDALKQVDYRADQSAVIVAGGITDDVSLRRLLIKNQCPTLTDGALTEIGVATHGDKIAIVLAMPFVPPKNQDAAQVALDVLQLVNEARAKPRRCGTKQFRAVAPLVLNEHLKIAAIAHAKDMAGRGSISHTGSDGSSPGDRIARAGYVWKFAGENVAAGQVTAKEVVDGWLTSPGHCANIMDPDFSHMAVAFAINTRQEIGIYWAQEFGKPR